MISGFTLGRTKGLAILFYGRENEPVANLTLGFLVI
jgi:hypothetical protein